jgi:hypothetical protein
MSFARLRDRMSEPDPRLFDKIIAEHHDGRKKHDPNALGVRDQEEFLPYI